MYVPNYDAQMTPSEDYNQWFKRLDTKLKKLNNYNSI